jgi:hypothetical protein
MTWQLDPDRIITAWLEDSAPTREPDGLLTRALSATARTPRRSRWAVPERWLPMALTMTS